MDEILNDDDDVIGGACVSCNEVFFYDDDQEPEPNGYITYDGWPMYLDAGMDVEDAPR